MPLDYLPIFSRRATPNPPRELKTVSHPAWHPLARSLRATRVALITSAALRESHQPAFPPSGDTSYRRVSSDPAVTDLRLDHRSRVGTDARRDPEIVFPRNALMALANRGLVGSVAPFHLSFVGGIRHYRELQEELVPALARELAEAGVDLAVLVPY